MKESTVRGIWTKERTLREEDQREREQRQHKHTAEMASLQGKEELEEGSTGAAEFQSWGWGQGGEVGTGEEPQVLKEPGGQLALWYASRPQNLTPTTQVNYRKGSTQRGRGK